MIRKNIGLCSTLEFCSSLVPILFPDYWCEIMVCFISDCRDVFGSFQCYFMKTTQRMSCSTNYMRTYCKKTCGLCGMFFISLWIFISLVRKINFSRFIFLQLRSWIVVWNCLHFISMKIIHPSISIIRLENAEVVMTIGEF